MVVRFRDDHGDVVDLIVELRREADVTRGSLTPNTEANSVSGSRSSILVLTPVEPSDIDLLSIDDYTKVIVVRRVPTIDLVKVERELHRVGIARDLVVRLEWITGSTIGTAVSSEELGEDGSASNPSVGPSNKRSILEVLLVDHHLWGTSSGCWPESGVACRTWHRVGCAASELCGETDVVETSTLVTEGTTKPSLEHDFDPSVGFVVRFRDDHGDMMNLIVEMGVEADVTRGGLTPNTEANTLSGSRASILVLTPIEPSDVDSFTVDDDTQVFVLRRVPTIDLVKVERELNRVGITRDSIVRFERVLRIAVIFAVSSEELGEDGSACNPSVGPPVERTVLEVFVDHLPGRHAVS